MIKNYIDDMKTIKHKSHTYTLSFATILPMAVMILAIATTAFCDTADNYFAIGVTKQAKGALEEAIANFTTAIELKPDYADAYIGRGAAKRAKGDRAGADEDFTKANKLKKDDAKACTDRIWASGNVFNDKPDRDRALADYASAIELKPDDIEAYRQRGGLESTTDDYDSAIADFTKVIELKTDDAVAYGARATAKRFKGNFDGAIADYTKAIAMETEPHNSGLYRSRAFVKQAKGDLDGANADKAKFNQLIAKRRANREAKAKTQTEPALNVPNGQEYKASDLPFNAVQLVFMRGGGYSEEVGADLKIEPKCSGLSLKTLFLGEHEIALQSTEVTPDAMIVTKDYGNLRVKMNMATFSYSILVTPHQEEQFRKLLSNKQDELTIEPNANWTFQRAKIIAQEPLGAGTLITVTIALDDPKGTKGRTYVTPQSPFVVSKTGDPVFWTGWMNTSPRDNMPCLWHPLTPASIEIEIKTKTVGQTCFTTRAVKTTDVSLKKVDSERDIHYVNDNTVEVSLLFDVKPEDIANVGIVTYTDSSTEEARDKGLELADFKAWSAKSQ